MTFTDVLAQQQSRIDAAREDYQDCNSKLNHLINQIEATDTWDGEALAKLNFDLEVVGKKTCSAMQAWNEAVDSMVVASTEPVIATMAEWEEAASLMPKGYRIKDGWFHDAAGGRSNKAPAVLTQRQIDILTGAIPIC